MPKRGAIQLSMNFIVMLILSIAVFGMGIYLVQRIHSSAGNRVDQADEQARTARTRSIQERQSPLRQRISRDRALYR